jgi:hypothetical protein
VIDLQAGNVEDVHNAAGLVDPIDDAVGAAPGAMTASERPEQRLADPARVVGQRGIAEVQDGGSNCFRKPLGDRPPRGSLEADLIPSLTSGGVLDTSDAIGSNRNPLWSALVVSSSVRRRIHYERTSPCR